MARRLGCSRSISRNPVSLPMLNLLSRRHPRRRTGWSDVNRIGTLHTEHPFILMRENFDEARLRLGPVLQNPRRTRTPSQLAMTLQQRAHFSNVSLRLERLQVNHRLVAAPR